MSVQLTKKDVQDLRKQGFSEEEISKAINELENEDLEQAYTSSNIPTNNSNNSNSYSMFGSRNNEDIAKWQLELNDILEKAEHVLRGDIVEFENGALVWKNNPDPDENTLNEKGVRIFMKILSMYVNRNTILSDYTDEQIRYKVLDFGKRMNNLIFTKYEVMGMDTEDKRKEYPALVGALVDIVHSAYARAKEGRERESYRKMINVSSQSNGMGMMGGVTVNSGGNSPKTRGILNPMRYIAGKYV